MTLRPGSRVIDVGNCGTLLLLALLVNVIGITSSIAILIAAGMEPFSDLGDYTTEIMSAVTLLLIPVTGSHLAVWPLLLVLSFVLLLAPLACAPESQREKVLKAYLLVCPIWILWLPCLALLAASSPSFNFFTNTKPTWLSYGLFAPIVVLLPLVGVRLFQRLLSTEPIAMRVTAKLAVQFSIALFITFFGTVCTIAIALTRTHAIIDVGFGGYLTGMWESTAKFVNETAGHPPAACPILVLVFMLFLPSWITAPRGSQVLGTYLRVLPLWIVWLLCAAVFVDAAMIGSVAMIPLFGAAMLAIPLIGLRLVRRRMRASSVAIAG